MGVLWIQNSTQITISRQKYLELTGDEHVAFMVAQYSID